MDLPPNHQAEILFTRNFAHFLYCLPYCLQQLLFLIFFFFNKVSVTAQNKIDRLQEDLKQLHKKNGQVVSELDELKVCVKNQETLIAENEELMNKLEIADINAGMYEAKNIEVNVKISSRSIAITLDMKKFKQT